MAPIK